MRLLRNNVVFVLADDARRAEMRRHASRRLALRELRKPERLAHLAEHQRDKVCELEARSEQELALAVQQCYRHVFYPSRHRVESADVDLAHSAVDIHSTSDQPGAGQRHVARSLADLNKLRYPEDEPDSPAYVRDRTPLKKEEITPAALRNEFRRDPGLPMLVGDDVFVRGVRLGVEQGEYIYRRGDLLLGPGDPFAEIVTDEQSVVFTMAFAKNRGIWPRVAERVETDAGGPAGGADDASPFTRTPGSGAANAKEDDQPYRVETPAGAVSAEGVLRDARRRGAAGAASGSPGEGVNPPWARLAAVADRAKKAKLGSIQGGAELAARAARGRPGELGSRPASPDVPVVRSPRSRSRSTVVLGGRDRKRPVAGVRRLEARRAGRASEPA